MATTPLQQSTRTQVLITVYSVHASAIITFAAYYSLLLMDNAPITLAETLAAYAITWGIVLCIEHRCHICDIREGRRGPCGNGYGCDLFLIFCYVLPAVAILFAIGHAILCN